jgi:hypothetical protein
MKGGGSLADKNAALDTNPSNWGEGRGGGLPGLLRKFIFSAVEFAKLA